MKALIYALIIAQVGFYSVPAKGACREALDACGKLVDAQQSQINHLKEDVSKLKDMAADAQKKPLVPFWVVLVSSTLTLGAGAVLAVPALFALGAGGTVGAVTTGMRE